MWDVDGGVQKTIFKGKGNLKVSVTDIFASQKFTATSKFAGQYLQASGHGESRQLRTSLIWRFGNNKVKAARQRQTGAEDEKNRTQSSGGLGNQ